MFRPGGGAVLAAPGRAGSVPAAVSSAWTVQTASFNDFDNEGNPVTVSVTIRRGWEQAMSRMDGVIDVEAAKALTRAGMSTPSDRGEARGIPLHGLPPRDGGREETGCETSVCTAPRRLRGGCVCHRAIRCHGVRYRGTGGRGSAGMGRKKDA